MARAIGFFLLILSLRAVSFAGREAYLYEGTFDEMGLDYTELLKDKTTDRWSELPDEKRIACASRYNTLLNDGVLDIRIALGYFDWTTGHIVYADGNNFGYSPSIDLGAFYSLRALLLRPCAGALRFCGFRQDPKNSYRFTRTVEIDGRRYPVQLLINLSSVTEYLALNLGRNRDEQKLRTKYMENYFASSLQSADAAFYFGHSRNGGGPDFAPPIFEKGKNKVDYDGYYEVVRPGLKKMVTALTQTEHKAPVIGLMSCASRQHFLSTIRSLSPDSGVITSLDVLNVDEVYTAMIGAIDALLRGQCQKSFYQSLRLTPGNQNFITMDGMFD